MKTAAIVLIAMMSFPLAVHAQKDSRPTPPPAQPGDKVSSPRKPAAIEGRVHIGDPASDFTLDSSTGTQVRLSRLRGDWIVLVFADRGDSLADLRKIHDRMKPLGARIVGVCREKARRLKSIAQQDSLSFLLLGDVTGEISAMYGLYDHDHSEIAPGFLVIDRRGVVRTAVLGQQLPAEQVAQIVRLTITGLR
jgi:peroxiredoxin